MVYLALSGYVLLRLSARNFAKVHNNPAKLTPLLDPVDGRGRAPDADPVAGGVELDGGAMEGGGHVVGVPPGQRPTQQLPELLLEARQPAAQPDKSKSWK